LDSDAEWTVELKQDGIFGIGICREGHLDIYSSAHDYKATILLEHPINAVFLGEFMFGSNWAYRHDEVGWFHVFDILAYDDRSLVERKLVQRRRLLQWVFDNFITWSPSCPVKIVDHYPCDLRDHLWAKYVDGQDYEGLVFKRNDESFTDAHWYRTKKLFSVEYIFCGVTEGKGRNSGKAGAILAGLLDSDGNIRHVCSIGGGLSDGFRQELYDNSDAYVGKVFTATGNKIFDSGALRHPNFKEWRDDKSAKMCTFEAALANRGEFVPIAS
jgi:ATP-dependent DNA ligase